MIPELLLLAAVSTPVSTPPPNFSNPFTDDITISYEFAPGLNFGVLPYTSELWPHSRDPAFPASTWNSQTLSANLSAISPETPETVSLDIDPPNIVAVTNWSTIYEVTFGVQIEGTIEWQWPGPDTARIERIMNHLRATFQSINAILRRDVGLNLKISHVNIREPSYPLTDQHQNDLDTIAHWQSLPIPHPYYFILRVGNIPGASTLGDACGPGIQITTAGYPFKVKTSDAFRDRQLQVMTHELGHRFLSVDHTQCYSTVGNSLELSGGNPIELCHQNNACYQGPTVCPPTETLSFMGYCSYCYPNQLLQIGPKGGLFATMARNRLISRIPCKTTIADLGNLLTMPDSDDDKIPDPLDNCRFKNNHDQIDTDLDGKGDVCDGCQITQTNPQTIWPLIPIAFILWRKNAHLYRRRLNQTNR